MAREFRNGDVRLATGEVASVRRFVEQGRDFSLADIAAMVAEQYKIMRAIIPIHRQLQDRGQIEVTTTPFAHPILPLLIDTDRATIDRPGATHPRRFAHPEDAEAQVRLAVACYERHFGRPPRGMWPAEGAVSQSAIPFFARHGVRWLATDRGVLARSGRWGYNVDDPDVLCQPYRAAEGEHAVSVFFRDTALSDAIGFQYARYANAEQAAYDFLGEIKERFAWQVASDEDRVLTVVLDGENAWGAYPEDGRPFLHALYRLLEHDAEITTVTFAEYLDGQSGPRHCPSFPGSADQRLRSVHRLVDRRVRLRRQAWTWAPGSARTRRTRAGSCWGGRATCSAAPARPWRPRRGRSRRCTWPKGSDWFWWFGADQDSGNDAEFDDLFRTHLRNVYRGLGVEPPAELDRHIVARAVLWTFTQQVGWMQPGDRLTVRTNCPGMLTWQIDGGEPQAVALLPAGGVMAGVQRYHLTLGPVPAEAGEVRFRFRCTQRGCDGRDICCKPDDYVVRIGQGAPRSVPVGPALVRECERSALVG